MHINVYKLISKEASNHSSFDKDIFTFRVWFDTETTFHLKI